MIAFIDQEKEVVLLYSDNGLVEIHFSDVESLLDEAKGQEVLYVTGAVETRAEEIVNLVRSFSPAPAAVLMGTEDITQGDKFFLRSLINGPLLLSDLDLHFLNPGDMKEIDARLKKAIQESVVLQEMIRNRKLEIVDTQRMRKIMRDHNRKEADKAVAKKKAEDKELENMIVDRPAEDIAANPGVEGHDDIIAMDLTNEVNRGPIEEQ